MVVPTPLVITSGNGAEVFESIDAALDDVSALVRLSVASRWPSAFRTLGKPVLLGVFALRADAADAAVP